MGECAEGATAHAQNAHPTIMLCVRMCMCDVHVLVLRYSVCFWEGVGWEGQSLELSSDSTEDGSHMWRSTLPCAVCMHMMLMLTQTCTTPCVEEHSTMCGGHARDDDAHTDMCGGHARDDDAHTDMCGGHAHVDDAHTDMHHAIGRLSQEFMHACPGNAQAHAHVHEHAWQGAPSSCLPGCCTAVDHRHAHPLSGSQIHTSKPLCSNQKAATHLTGHRHAVATLTD